MMRKVIFVVVLGLAAWTAGGELPAEEPDSAGAGASGATSHDFWAFQLPRRHVPRAVEKAGWARQPIDTFILAELERHGLSPAPPAGKRTLIRRVTFDLIGLPPEPEDVRAFVEDTSPDAYEKLVDRLLASPHFGEKWARHWMDVARYGSDQAENPNEKNYGEAWRYREWLIRALNRDEPYDRFVRLQLAADQMPGSDPDDLAALGLLGLGPQYIGAGSDSELQKLRLRAEEWEDRVDVVARGFLGLTLACARCHDHKYDPIDMEDYYALAGVFASSRLADVALVAKDEREKWGRLRDERDRLKALSRQLKSRAGGEPPERAKKTELEVRSIDGRRAKVEKKMKSISGKSGQAHGVADLPKPKDLSVFLRGDPAMQGDRVPRRFPTVLSRGQPILFTRGSGRIDLADAIAHRDNPLTARVFVNRVWTHCFGRGLVDSPSNFGELGERPTHPELLDDLALRFMEGGWSIKKLIREIVTSETYRQDSLFDAASFEKDPDNRYLWRMSRRRLPVEAWRDAVLSASGVLDRRIGGGSIGSLGEYYSLKGFRGADSTEHRRRTIYSRISRYRPDAMLTLFDFPDPNVSVGKRVDTITPLQHLFLMNSSFMRYHANAMLDEFDDGPESEAPASAEVDQHVVKVYELLFARPPGRDEMEAAREFIVGGSVDQGDMRRNWQQFMHGLLMSNEMIYID